jgi:hypothetical protein
MENILETLSKFQKRHPNIYIGGSVSLILQNVIPYRIPKDIDIISTNRIHIYDLFEVKKEKHRLIKKFKHDGLKFDLFINPNAQYIEYIYNGYTFKLSPVDEVYQWKLKDQNVNTEKHANDLKHYEKIKRDCN